MYKLGYRVCFDLASWWCPLRSNDAKWKTRHFSHCRNSFSHLHGFHFYFLLQKQYMKKNVMTAEYTSNDKCGNLSRNQMLPGAGTLINTHHAIRNSCNGNIWSKCSIKYLEEQAVLTELARLSTISKIQVHSDLIVSQKKQSYLASSIVLKALT